VQNIKMHAAGLVQMISSTKSCAKNKRLICSFQQWHPCRNGYDYLSNSYLLRKRVVTAHTAEPRTRSQPTFEQEHKGFSLHITHVW